MLGRVPVVVELVVMHLLLLLLSVELVLLVLLRHSVHYGLAGHDWDVVVGPVADLGECARRGKVMRRVRGRVHRRLVGHEGHGLVLVGVHVGSRLHGDHLLGGQGLLGRLVVSLVAPVKLA